MLGMITAFAECLAGEAKKLAFSPPFYPEDYKSLRKKAEQICREQGVFIWYEENADLPEDKRVHWLVLFKYPEVLDEYKKLRQEGFNPALHFEKFMSLLSYGTMLSPLLFRNFYYDTLSTEKAFHSGWRLSGENDSDRG